MTMKNININNLGIKVYRRKFAIFPRWPGQEIKSTLIIKASDVWKLLCGHQ